MSVLMLHNHIPKIISNQKNKKFESLFSTPIAGKTVVVVGTGNLGGAMIRLLAPLGPKIIGVNRKGEKVDGCSKVISVDKIDSILPKADILYLAVPETPGTKNLISHKRLDLLKPSCGIVNIGRQSTIDYDALCEKLIAKKIAGLELIRGNDNFASMVPQYEMQIKTLKDKANSFESAEMMLPHMFRFTKDKLRVIKLKNIKAISKKLSKKDKGKKK